MKHPHGYCRYLWPLHSRRNGAQQTFVSLQDIIQRLLLPLSAAHGVGSREAPLPLGLKLALDGLPLLAVGAGSGGSALSWFRRAGIDRLPARGVDCAGGDEAGRHVTLEGSFRD